MNQYTLDGIPLKDPELRWFTDRDTGIRILPARRQPEQRFPHVDGLNFIPDAPYDPGEVAIQLQVRGETYTDFRKNLEFIMALIGQRNKLIELRDHYDPDNQAEDRIAMVSLSGSVEPRMIDRQSARVGALFSVPGTFWRSADYLFGETPAVANAGLMGTELTSLRGGNGPIDDMILRVRGAFSTLRIEDPITGYVLNIETPLLADETMLIDTKGWKAIIVKGTTVDTWTLNQGRDVSWYVTPNRGNGSMFRVEPGLVGQMFVYRLNITGTNFSTVKPTVGYKAKRSYL